ncbi:hypothetical protein A2Z67_06325 [Candidatus Woesebacteria bacterium RBG_13_36_22]|uniref:Phage portal protein n=1 Tax=Candidatus Woesebacteria bacterium RBG_13_36_22 TaxID=1802478 RepID=A0A1F7WZX9_9BACT|nr:MAG: hypothetical protein A2Z67_06325 [Candidatus Woesebacteria bacterium RBG_13_36_22]
MAYKLRSKVISTLSNLLKPIKDIRNTGKAIVGGTIYQFRLMGSLISAQAPKYDFRKIRQIYRRFGFIRQALAVYKHRATSELPDIVCDNIRARNILMDRLHEMHIFDELPNMFQDLTSFGNVFYEIVYDEEEIDTNVKRSIDFRAGEFDVDIPQNLDVKNIARRLKRVVGVKRLEPDYMRIVSDKYGRILYYVNVRDSSNYVILEPWRIIHVKLDALPGDVFGIGLIEGAIDDIAALRMVEDLQLQLIKHDIYPFRMFACPSNEVILEVEAKLAEQERFGDLVVPSDVKMSQSTVGNASQDLRALMKHYQENIFMDVGVPMGMLIEGSKTNKATATVQSDAFNFNVYSFINQLYIPLERFSKLVLLFEGIASEVTWNYKDIDRTAEQSVRKEVTEWFKEGMIDREDAINLLDTYGAFRYMNERTKNRLIRKSKPAGTPESNPEEGQTVELPPGEGDGSNAPELGDRIADTTKIEKPSKITDRIKERVIKPDGTSVEKTTERIQQSIKFAEKLRNQIINCNFDFHKISQVIIGTLSNIPNSSTLNGQLDNLCNDIDACIDLYSQEENFDQYEYQVSKSCALFSRHIIEKFE